MTTIPNSIDNLVAQAQQQALDALEATYELAERALELQKQYVLRLAGKKTAA